jgi:cytochrome c biogenesis protein CcmG/thiol:disulfide interchange protein DsbE
VAFNAPLPKTEQGVALEMIVLKFRGMRPQNIISRPVLACLLLLAALGAFAADETGQPAPHFRAKTTTGDQFNNASVKGKVVLFEFWTTWCKYCEAEASMVDDVAEEFADKGLIVLAVDVLEPDQKVKKYLMEHPRSVPIVLTKDTNLAAMYNAQSYPIYVVIDRDGNIAAEQRGAAGDTALRRLLKRAGLESKPESKD